jgi:hypothetical protein
MSDTRVREASEGDVPLILTFIRELADYEKLSHEVVATEEGLRESLFAGRRYAEVLIAEHDGAPAGFRALLSQLLDVPASRGSTWRTST